MKRFKKLDEIVLAIPDTKSNVYLRDFAKDYDIKSFLGSESNLVNRYYEADCF